MSCNAHENTNTSAFAGFDWSLAGFIEAVKKLYRAQKHRHQLRGLLELSDHHLADMGLSKGTIYRALNTPWHKDPSERLRRNGKYYSN